MSELQSVLLDDAYRNGGIPYLWEGETEKAITEFTKAFGLDSGYRGVLGPGHYL